MPAAIRAVVPKARRIMARCTSTAATAQAAVAVAAVGAMGAQYSRGPQNPYMVQTVSYNGADNPAAAVPICPLAGGDGPSWPGYVHPAT